jgi:prophage tail gpP-like protein
MTTTRVRLEVDGQVHDTWTAVHITRDLADISGGFELELHDAARLRRALPGSTPAMPMTIEAGSEVRLSIDGELVLLGHVDDLKVSIQAEDIRIGVSGRDRTGDLVDSAATLDGPVEFRNLTLTEIAERICKPFDIAVRAETDVGAPFTVFSLDAAERAMEAIERGCRQRAVLAVSDGVGGLLLTRSGARRGPAALSLPGNVQAAVLTRSWRDRHSAYVVKGQTKPARAGGPAFTPPASPIVPGFGPPNPQAQERATIVMTGRAVDPEVVRHRPLVALARSQSGGASVQTQAEWMLRIARGQSETLAYTVLDWRAGTDKRLWRPNELVTVDDPIAGILGDMLVAGVTFSHSDQDGSITQLRLVGPEAFDLVAEAEDQRRATRENRDAARPRNRVASPITGPQP